MVWLHMPSDCCILATSSHSQVPRQEPWEKTLSVNTQVIMFLTSFWSLVDQSKAKPRNQAPRPYSILGLIMFHWYVHTQRGEVVVVVVVAIVVFVCNSGGGNGSSSSSSSGSGNNGLSGSKTVSAGIRITIVAAGSTIMVVLAFQALLLSTRPATTYPD